MVHGLLSSGLATLSRNIHLASMNARSLQSIVRLVLGQIVALLVSDMNLDISLEPGALAVQVQLSYQILPEHLQLTCLSCCNAVAAAP